MEFMCQINSSKNTKVVYFEEAFFSFTDALFSLKFYNTKQL